jgi:hypothetical protein
VDELEKRLDALASSDQQGEDFDGRSWAWLLLLGVILPAVLILIGWFFT